MGREKARTHASWNASSASPQGNTLSSRTIVALRSRAMHAARRSTLRTSGAAVAGSFAILRVCLVMPASVLLSVFALVVVLSFGVLLLGLAISLLGKHRGPDRIELR